MIKLERNAPATIIMLITVHRELLGTEKEKTTHSLLEDILSVARDELKYLDALEKCLGVKPPPYHEVRDAD